LKPAVTQAGLPRTVCVITRDDNLSADRVVMELEGLGSPVLRFDLADIPGHVSLDACLDDGRWTGALSAHGRRTVALDDIGAILWWHPGSPRITAAGLSEAERQWAERETVAGLAGILTTLDCLHVNHPSNTRAAQLKVDALVQAARSGLRVPPTWVGNAPAGAANFASSSPHGAVCKSLVAPAIIDGGYRSFYTSCVAPGSIDESIAASGHQLQHAIVKECEVRLIVVGDGMFAARIDAHSESARADFRSDYEALAYAHIEIPETVRTGVTALMDHYGLVYAAIDLLVDPEQRWYLIDLNPAGQYDWLQAELPLPISAAMAHLLASGADPR
jgi:hypothetical protein